MRSGFLLALVAIVTGSILWVGSSVSPQTPPQATVAPGGSRTLVCPTLDPAQAQVTVSALGAANSIGQVGGAAATPGTGLVTVAQPAAPVTLTGGQSVAANSAAAVLAGARQGLWLAGCSAPGSVAWFPGLVAAAGQEVDVVLTNRDPKDARVDLRLLGDGGPIDAPTGRDLLVPANGSRVVALSSLTNVTSPLTVGVRSSTGRVAAVVRQSGALGADWQVPVGTPATELVIAGVPGGAGPRTLVVANPSERRTTVSLFVLGGSGPFQPAAASTISLNGLTTTTIELADSLQSEAVGVRLVSGEPVVASLRAQTAPTGGDLAVAVAAPPLAGVALLPVAGTAGLHLANPGEDSADVVVARYDSKGARLGDAKVTVAAGSSLVVPLAGEGLAWVEVRTTGKAVRAALVVTRLGALDGLGWAQLQSGLTGADLAPPVLDPAVGS